MNSSFQQAANDLLSGKNGEKINARKNDIQRIAESADGLKVKEMLSKNFDLEGALERGDMESVKSAITSIMSTDSGARLAKSLGDILK